MIHDWLRCHQSIAYKQQHQKPSCNDVFLFTVFFSKERQFTINLRHTESRESEYGSKLFLDQTSSSILNLSIYTHKARGLTFFPIRFLVFVASKGDPLQKATPFVSVSITSKVNISALECVRKSRLQVPYHVKVFTVNKLTSYQK